MVRFDDHLAEQMPRRDLDFDPPAIFELFGGHFFIGLSRALFLAWRAWAHRRPIPVRGRAFFAERKPAFLRGQPCLFLLEPRRVVPFQRVPFPYRAPESTGHIIQKVTVVGDSHDGPRCRPGGARASDTFGIEMVRGLV